MRRAPHRRRCGALAQYVLLLALFGGDEADVVVGVVLVDADEGTRRVVLVVEGTDAGRTRVADLAAVLEESHTVGVAGALLAIGGTRDRGQVLLDRLGRSVAALHRGERGEDDAVVGLGGVGVVVERLTLGELVPRVEAVLEGRSRVVARDRALGAVAHAGVELVAVAGG